MDAKSIGEKLAQALRLPGRMVCVVATEEPLEGSVQIAEVDRCVARVIYMMAMKTGMGPVHFGASAKKGICPGGQGWCGVSAMSPKTKFFISTGTPDFRNGEAEYLKPDPDAADRFFSAPGKIVPPSKYITVMGSDEVKAGHKVLSFIMFGNAESIRNAGGLIQFVSEEIFGAVMMPGGPSCASMLSYAAGMAENAPKGTAFIGPVDPTGNSWLPPDLLSMSVPFELAERMASSVDASFLGKRPEVAFPSKRLGLEEKDPHA